MIDNLVTVIDAVLRLAAGWPEQNVQSIEDGMTNVMIILCVP
jgi:hypothetical protein